MSWLLRGGLGLAVTGLAIMVLLRTAAAGDVLGSMRSGNPLVLIPAVPLYFVGTWIRSLRWRLLLSPRSPSTARLFRVLVIGLMANDLLPGRVGELARVFLLARGNRVPVGTALASILVERVLDGLVLTGLLIGGIAVVGAGEGIGRFALGVGALFVFLAVAILAAALAPGTARRLGNGLAHPLPPRWRSLAVQLVDGAVEGLRQLARWEIAVGVLTLSVVAWAFEAGMYFVILLGFPVPGGVMAAIVGTAAGNLATVIPSSPGYIGTFDVALEASLVGLFGAATAAAVSYAVVVHVVLLLPVIFLGLILLWREELNLPQLTRGALGRGTTGFAGPREPLI